MIMSLSHYRKRYANKVVCLFCFYISVLYVEFLYESSRCEQDGIVSMFTILKNRYNFVAACWKDMGR